MPLSTNVFFYGLFMDPAVLEAQGVTRPAVRPGVVREWALRIGNRATLVPKRGESVHGVVLSLTLLELDRLYADPSVQLYRPVAVLVEVDQGPTLPAMAYVLPEPPGPEEKNPVYAAKLRAVAERMGFPSEYVASIV